MLWTLELEYLRKEHCSPQPVAVRLRYLGRLAQMAPNAAEQTYGVTASGWVRPVVFRRRMSAAAGSRNWISRRLARGFTQESSLKPSHGDEWSRTPFIKSYDRSFFRHLGTLLDRNR